MELTVNNQQVTQHIAPSTRRHLERLSKTDFRGKLPPIPRSLSSSEKEALVILGRELRANHVSMTPAECVTQITALLIHFWDAQITEDAAARLHADWYDALKGHKLETVDRACKDWLSTAKRKPLPADILELCNEDDKVPNQLVRMKALWDLPTKDPEPDYDYDNGKLVGDPVELAKFMKYAQKKGIEFPERQQMLYLNSGVKPEWAMWMPADEVRPEAADMPSREELLAQMSPEARVAALEKQDSWRKAG